MSLVPFHRILIAGAIIFCFGFAAWELLAYRRDGSIAAAVIAGAFLFAGGLLAVYLRHLRRILRLPAAETVGRRAP
jgi:hypothetical protein